MAAVATEPAGYYASCEGASGKNLLTALSAVVSSHTAVSYDGLWTLYGTSDLRPNGKIWDMYSTKEYTYRTDQCGSYQAVGSCYNREHSFPKSWFDDKSPMVSDAYHIYPTDGKVNGQRSNYPYGECEGGTTLPGSGTVRALGRLGKCTFPGYSGTVFEPDDEYKGDFARSYFYMAAAYNSQIASWSSPMLASNSYPAFSQWAINLLLKWHRQDPVSQKELDRNEAVAARQHNRNPFIDHPDLAEHIWGDKTSVAWNCNATYDPAIILPVSGTTVDIGTTVVGVPRSATVTIKGQVLTQAVTLTTSDADFTATPRTIAAATANAGTTATVTFTPTDEGSYTGSLTVASGSATSTIIIIAKAIGTLPAGPVRGIGEDSFLATWSCIGDADANGEYTLDVRCQGESLDEFPRSVRATDESFVVEGLEPSTTYTYTVASEHLRSEPVTVTTLAPQPSVTFLFDGTLSFAAPAGQPSEAAELLVDIANITDPVLLSVAAPFELSTDKATWARTATLDPEEDRVYLRMYSVEAGTFRSSLVATAGDYRTDEVEFQGTAVSGTGYFEDFEMEWPGSQSYITGPYTGTGGVWNFSNAGIFAEQDAAKAYRGQSVRMGKTATSMLAMAEDYPAGFGVVTVQTSLWSGDATATFHLEYSADGGTSWRSAGQASVESTSWAPHTFTVNCAGPARLRLRQSAGARFMVDNIEATTYTNLVPDAAAPYHTWDAFARHGALVIEASMPVHATVSSIDGRTAASITVAGSTALDLAPGLYIVTVDNFSRRVLIK